MLVEWLSGIWRSSTCGPTSPYLPAPDDDDDSDGDDGIDGVDGVDGDGGVDGDWPQKV